MKGAENGTKGTPMAARIAAGRDSETSGKMWEITFSDMLTLLLTFFVFIISISTFKTEEYKQFWEVFRKEKKDATKSFKFDLIKGIHTPKLSRHAQALLTELEETFTTSDFQGADVNYDENKITLMISEQLGFEGGRYELKKESQTLLEGLVPALNAGSFDIEVEGHTDSLQSEKIDNMELSLNRALSVARYLVEKGVDKHKVSVSGYGPHRPVSDNRTPEGRRLNRRVEIHVIINT